MKWGQMRQSGNVEDRRGRGLMLPGGPAGLGLGGVLLLLLGSLLFGVNPLDVLNQIQGGAPTQTQEAPAADDPDSRFVRSVLGDLEDTWSALFERSGQQYEPPRLVLYSGAVSSACGSTSSAVGPFYCGRDARVYLDSTFFDRLAQNFGVSGDFAAAYVIAHEVGHHVQNLLGIMDQVAQRRARSDPATANALSVRLELQADCFAGVWGHYANRRGLLDFGDPKEAIGAASAIGDDNLQRRSQGYVVPDAFTHGSSEQRVRWFRTGFESGDPERCDTFSVRNP